MVDSLGFLHSVVFFVMLAVAAVIDGRTRKIPNVLVFFGAFLGLCFQGSIYYTLGFSAQGLLIGLGGAGSAFALFFTLYWLGGMGAGDVKLMTAVGALTSWRFVIWSSLFTAIVGAILAILWLLFKGGWRDAAKATFTLKRQERIEVISKADPTRTIPYGIAIGLGSLWAVIEFIRQGMPLPWDLPGL